MGRRPHLVPDRNPRKNTFSQAEISLQVQERKEPDTGESAVVHARRFLNFIGSVHVSD
jgi:hypothetical protein